MSTPLQWLFGDAARGLSDIRFVFDNPLGLLGSLALLLGLALLLVLFYPRRLSALSAPRRRALTALKLGAILLALTLLLRPALRGYRFDPSENYVLLLFDNSASMAIAPEGGQSRGERMRRAYQEHLASFEEPLSARFQLAPYGFGEGVQRIRQVGELEFASPESAIQNAVKTALGDFQGIPVNAVIVFSDGIEQPGDGKIQIDRQIPVFTVAVGAQSAFRDLEIGTVSHIQAQGEGSPIRIDASFHATGFAGHKAVVEVLDRDTVLASQTAAIESDDASQQVRLELTPKSIGWLTYQVRVRRAEPVGPRDEVAQNDSTLILVDNREKRYDLLYFCGRPNWENKFVQQAVRQDPGLKLTSVLRISAAETKFVYRGKESSLANPLFEGFDQDELDQPRYDESVFLRFGHDRSLAGKGFPETDLELYKSQILIIGEVEANFFSQEQFELMRSFVVKRGGVLLLLGGPHSFSEGGYQNTVLTGMLPVMLERKAEKQGPTSAAPFAVAPTLEGLQSGVWALDPNTQRSERLWEELPALEGLNRFALVRPQATTLAKSKSELGAADDLPLFALQRYGEGRTAVFATSSTWQWHMGTDAKDERHRRFWRQLLRGLARDVQSPLVLRDKQDSYVIDRETQLDILIRDRHFDERSGLETRLVLTDPLGEVVTPGVEESLREAGIYQVRFTPRREGLWQLALTTFDGQGQELGRLEEALLVTADHREYRHARPNPAFLAKLASTTGGASFDLEDLDEIPDQIPYTRHDQAEQVTVAIWHWPPLFVILAALLCADWYWRRRWGQA